MCTLTLLHTYTSTHIHVHSAYGYGFLMVLLVSLLSLLGVIILPLLNKNRGVYLYCNTLLIAMGTSALFCSAVLNLLPKVRVQMEI